MNRFTQTLYRPLRSFWLLFFVGTFFLAACNNDQDTPLGDTNDLSEVIAENPNLNSFQTASEKAGGLADILSGETQYTIFAPDDQAFTNYLGDRSLDDLPASVLNGVLRNHIVAGNLNAASLADGTLTTLGGQTLNITRSGDAIYINGSTKVLATDLEADNGVIHIVNAVMDHDSEASMTIAELVVNRDNLSTLEMILTSGNYDDLLNAAADPAADLTLFAPDNDAFAALLDALELSLGDIPESVVRDILMYHLLATSKMAGEISDGEMLTTMLGEDIMVMKDGGMVTLNPGDWESMVEEADIMATNGYIHQVDAVLIPPSVQAVVGTVVEPAYFNKDFTTLVAAVVKAGLLEALLDADDVTIFAPTNDAFANAGIVVEDTDAETLANVLQYHVIPSAIPAEDLLNMLQSAYMAPANQVDAPSLLGPDLYFTLYNEMIYINGNTRVDPANIMTDKGVIHVLPENVLMPPMRTIAEIVQAHANAEYESDDEDGEFNVLLAALQRASGGEINFLEILSDPSQNVTVFAPTDAAFMELLNITNLDELEDIPVDVLTDVLSYHVIVVPFFSKDLLNNNSPATLYSSISIDVTENLTIVDREDDNMDANIVMADVLATNGVIHVIDQVLLPFDLVQ